MAARTHRAAGRVAVWLLLGAAGTLVPPCLKKLTPVTDADVECVAQRHLFLKDQHSGELKDRAVGAGHRCRHGWPQALVTSPIWPQHRLGDVARLTCPLLVSAIDRYEKQGALRSYNERLEKDDTWRLELYQAHSAHRELRKELLAQADPEEMARVRETMGNATVDLVLSTGIASTRFDENSTSDVKCLHAQVADELSRGNNAIGRQVLEDLAAAGVEVDGTEHCCDHCNVHVPLSEARWTLQIAKNKLGQRLRRQRRREGAPEGPGPEPLPLKKRMPPKNSYLTSR